MIDVSAGGVPGQIFIKAGSIIHAQTEGRRGQSAFTHLASFPDAEFSLRQFVEPSEQSVDRQWEFLVLEAFRLQEQLAQQPPADAKGSETSASPPGAATIPAAAAPASPRAVAPVSPKPGTPVRTSREPETPPMVPLRMAADATSLREKSSVEPVRREPKKSAPPPEAAPAAQEPEALVVNSPPATLRLVATADQAAFQIEELLICSSQREVLCEWRCSRSEERIRLVQAVCDQASELGKALKLGKFDRVEFLTPNNRFVIQSRGDSSVLMRSNVKGAETPRAAPATGQALDRWLELQLQTNGVLACGVIRPGGTSVNRSRSPNLSVEGMDAAWRQVVATFDEANRNGVVASSARWIYEDAQFYALRRSDGVLMGVILKKDPQTVDVGAVERSLADFSLAPAP